MRYIFFLIIVFFAGSEYFVYSQTVTIQVDVSAGRKPISPFIFGKNNCLSDDPSKPLSSVEWQFLRDAGVKMLRENGGNNATKYNWRLKLASHPDWYNNVYPHDWDFAAKSMQDNLSGTFGIWAFQLIGKVASNTSNNFNDYKYNQSKWWSGVNQNLAGGGVINSGGGSKAATDGNPNLYLKDWPADSTVGILDKWFGNNGLGLQKTPLTYWSMDNEPEIWSGTHDDIMANQLSAEAFMQSYFSVAKKARAKFPEIKLMGPVPANEWQWYKWGTNTLSINGTNYSWLEFFIKRIADEQKANGIRLLDVLDIHFYPSTNASADIVQLHRVFFDKTYVFPEATGVKTLNGGWDNSINKEYIFERCREWLTKYLGTDHGVTLSVSEIGIGGSNPNVTAVWYASTLGTFANEGVEIFTPWSWKIGMWETLHLFSRYSKSIHVQSTSSSEDFISAYSSVNTNLDSLTVVLVNRSLDQNKSTTINISNFTVPDGSYQTIMLSNLPGNETFQSHAVNALKTGNIQVTMGVLSVPLAPLSITALLLTSTLQPTKIKEPIEGNFSFEVVLNPYSNIANISYQLERVLPVKLEVFDLQGKLIQLLKQEIQQPGKYSLQFNQVNMTTGTYIYRLKAGSHEVVKKTIVLK